MGRKPKVKHLIQNERPPEVEIAGVKYQFESQLELRFALLLEMQRQANAIEQWQYEPTRFAFPTYKTKPKEYTPDFVTIQGEETTIYEGMAYITPQYIAKFKRLSELHGDWKIVIVMDKPDSDKRRQPKYQRLVDQKVVDHVWYVSKDFKKLGILEEAARLCFIAGAQAVEAAPQQEPEQAPTSEPLGATRQTAEGKFAFQRIASVGKVKTYKRTEKGIEVAFKDLHFGDGHRELLDYWMDEHVKLRVTLEEYEQVKPREKPPETPLFGQAPPAPEPEPQTPGPTDSAKLTDQLVVPLPASYQADIEIVLQQDADGLWWAAVDVQLKKLGVRWASGSVGPLPSKARALKAADAMIGAWLQEQNDFSHRLPCEQKVTNQVSIWIAELENSSDERADNESSSRPGVDDSDAPVPPAD